MLSEGHDSARQRTHCVACNLRRLCLPGGLADQDTLAFETLVTVQRRIGRGTALVSAGEPFSSVYATRLGSFKAVLLSESGHEQITGFYMTGEMIGLDGIDTGVHQATIVAMEESEVCSIPFAALQRLAAINPHVQRQLHRALSRELGLYQGVMLLLGTMTAEQKMATFILSLSKRFALRGFSGAQFSFRMSRAEIGSFLGITVETVSRTLTRIQERGLINIRARELTILDLPNLRKSSGR